MTQSFAKQVEAWTRKAERRLQETFQEAAKDAAENLIGRMPHESGYLKSSVKVRIGSIPKIKRRNRPTKNTIYKPDLGQISSKIEAAKLGDAIGIGVTAAYGPLAEYGANGHAAHGMVRLTVQDWPVIVQRAASKVKSRT